MLEQLVQTEKLSKIHEVIPDGGDFARCKTRQPCEPKVGRGLGSQSPAKFVNPRTCPAPNQPISLCRSPRDGRPSCGALLRQFGLVHSTRILVGLTARSSANLHIEKHPLDSTFWGSIRRAIQLGGLLRRTDADSFSSPIRRGTVLHGTISCYS